MKWSGLSLGRVRFRISKNIYLFQITLLCAMSSFIVDFRIYSTEFLLCCTCLVGMRLIDFEHDANLPNVQLMQSVVLQHWKNNGMRAIWLKIPLELARFVGPSVDEFSFVFHHAEEVLYSSQKVFCGHLA